MSLNRKIFIRQINTKFTAHGVAITDQYLNI